MIDWLNYPLQWWLTDWLTDSVSGKVSKRCPHQALTGTRYPTLPGFYFYYPYPNRKSFENFRVQGSNYSCCFHTGLYHWCQLLSSRGKGFSFIIPPYTGFRNMQVTICQKHSSWTNTTTSCNYDCNFEVFTLFCSELRRPSEIFYKIFWELFCDLRIFWL